MGGPAEGPMWINFKKEWNVAGTGWTSYRRDSESMQSNSEQAIAAEAQAETHNQFNSGQPDKDPVTDASTASAGDTEAVQSHTVQMEVQPSTGSAEVVRKNEAAQANVNMTSIEVTSNAELRVVDSLQGEQEEAKTPETSDYQASLFVGELMKMSQRNVVALNMENVIMCYVQPEVGGACRAANASKEEADTEWDTLHEDRNDTHFLPPLTWGSDEVFLGSEVSHIETVRLTSSRFVVCFEQASDSTITCTLGIVSAEGTSVGLRCAFRNSLVLGHGRLISITSASAGSQLIACYSDEGKRSVTCRWADTLEDAGTKDVELKWAENEPQIFKTTI
jgi:hypothetical protein